MLKRFFTKSILLQGLVGIILCMLLFIPAVNNFGSHPNQSIVGIGAYLFLNPLVGIYIAAIVGSHKAKRR